MGKVLAVAVLTVATSAFAQPVPKPPAKRAAPPATGRWVVKRSVSQMDDSQTVTLSLRANSTITGWPAKVVTPTLILRCKEGDVEAYIVTGMPPHVEHGNTEGATVQVRFDKQPASAWNLGRSTDNEALFFENAKHVIETMLSFNSMRFRFTPFNSSPQEAGFTLAGLRPAIRPLFVACEWDPEKERRETEALELQTIKERTERLVNMSVPDIRRSLAAYDLSNMRSPNLRLAVPALIQALKDPYGPVRHHAANALGAIADGAADAIPALEELVASEKDASIVKQAKEALVKIRPAVSP